MSLYIHGQKLRTDDPFQQKSRISLINNKYLDQFEKLKIIIETEDYSYFFLSSNVQIYIKDPDGEETRLFKFCGTPTKKYKWELAEISLDDFSLVREMDINKKNRVS